MAVELDLMQPLDASKAPKVHIPPLNHIGVWVDNIDNAVKELTDKGVRFAPGGIRKGAGSMIFYLSLINCVREIYLFTVSWA